MSAAKPEVADERNLAAPFVSVIVPVYDDVPRLRCCLAALERQAYHTDRYEVIVVDNGSPEAVAPHIEPYRHAIAAYEPQAGSYAARNRGVEAAKGAVLAFTDADCIPGTGWLAAGVASLQATGAALVGGRIEVFPRNAGRASAVELYEIMYAFPQELNVRAGFSVTANLFALREVFADLGGFDAGLKSGGDRDWVTRAVKAGYRLDYSHSACVRHPARQSLKELFQRAARFAGGDYDRAGRERALLRRARRDALLKLKPPLSVLRRVAAGGIEASPRTLAGVMAVAYLTNLAYAGEWLRLELGSQSRR